jgi:hypothetical protein
MEKTKGIYAELNEGKRIWLQTGLELRHSEYKGFNPKGVFSGIGISRESSECFFTNLVFINALRELKIGILDSNSESFFRSKLIIRFWAFVNESLLISKGLREDELIQPPSIKDLILNKMNEIQREFFERAVRPKFEKNISPNIYIKETNSFSIEDLINDRDIYHEIENNINGLDIVLWHNFNDIIAYKHIDKNTYNYILSNIRETAQTYVNQHGYNINVGISIDAELSEKEVSKACFSKE